MKKTDLDDIARACSDCGTCLSACPVYQARRCEPDSPRGKVNLIKAVRDGRLQPSAATKEFIYRCLLCGGCENICPAGVAYVDMMIEQRNILSGGSAVPWRKKLVLGLYRPLFMRALTPLLRLLHALPWGSRLLLPRCRPASLRRHYTRDRQRTYDVLLFPGCVLTYFYPQLVVQIKALLESRGYSVLLPRGLQCCGFPFLSQGWRRRFLHLRNKNQALFRRWRFRAVVVPCATGTLALRKFYDLGETPVHELTEFLHCFAAETAVDPSFAAGASLTFHDPCHNLKSLRQKEEPRRFLRQFGERFRDDGEGLCCGFGGLFKVGFPATSQAIWRRKADRLAGIGADAVVTSCPGCYLQLQGRIPQQVYFFSEIFPPPAATAERPPRP